ncbi:MAG: uroporphyrinogen decarboxylase family protein [Spirochaetota bacterium]
MDSRERVMTSVSLGKPDRIPLDFSANEATLSRLHRDLNTRTHHELLTRLHADIIDIRGVVDPLYRGPIPRQRELPGGIAENFWGWRTKVMQTPTGAETSYCDFILKDCTTVEELMTHRWPKADWFDFSGFSERLGEWRGFAVMASGASIWQHPTFLRGIEQLLMDILIAPDIAAFMIDTFTDFYIDYFDRMFSAAPGRIDILRIADDLGMQDRLLVSPDVFRDIFVPRLRRIIDMAKSHGVKVMFHSCGAIVPLIDSIIDAGVDILDPIQVTAKGMDPAMLKERFGTRLCLHGAIDTQYLLPCGTPADVQNAVISMADILGENGGFIMSPSHVLQSDVPTDNIIALYDTASQRRYSKVRMTREAI